MMKLQQLLNDILKLGETTQQPFFVKKSPFCTTNMTLIHFVGKQEKIPK